MPLYLETNPRPPMNATRRLRRGRGRWRAAGKRHKFFGRRKPVVEFEHFLHVQVGVVICFHAATRRGAHFLDQIGTIKQEPYGVGKLFAVTVGVEQAGNTMLQELGPRA